ncbi:MAG: fatty acid hydroxylase family protein, partial [Alphaproteobacteria bacterium]|nr:fatty acid hydroxylase family protein [Alphaproteobacteria bacterium]
DRGVIGHIFNGYSTAHVKPYKRKLIGTVDDPLAGAAKQPA